MQGKLRSLEDFKDHNPKNLLTMDFVSAVSHNDQAAVVKAYMWFGSCSLQAQDGDGYVQNITDKL